jgi:hypothetical protein
MECKNAAWLVPVAPSFPVRPRESNALPPFSGSFFDVLEGAEVSAIHFFKFYEKYLYLRLDWITKGKTLPSKLDIRDTPVRSRAVSAKA